MEGREVKFRGLSSSGKWVYGSLIKAFGKCYITSSESEAKAKDVAEYLGGIYTKLIPNMCVEVDPKTVGQFTGLQDRNGVDIYEGDFCQITYSKTDNWKGQVKFLEGTWVVGNWRFELHKERYAVRIIGNIHEHPNLLKQ